jgi:peroxiredoxin
MAHPGECREFLQRLGLAFPMIADPQRELYRMFHLTRMSPLRAADPRVLLKGFSALARGHGIGTPKGDVLQLPGVFVIGKNGRICRAFTPADPAGHPSPGDLLAALSDCPAA